MRRWRERACLHANPRVIPREGATRASGCRVENGEVIDPYEFSPWDFWRDADSAAHQRQREVQRILAEREGYSFGEQCFISDAASVDNDELRLGEFD